MQQLTVWHVQEPVGHNHIPLLASPLQGRKELPDTQGRNLFTKRKLQLGSCYTVKLKSSQPVLFLSNGTWCLCSLPIAAELSAAELPARRAGRARCCCDCSMADEAVKLPLRRLELPIHKFIKVAIPTDLERLHKHQVNIEKYQRGRQWERLHQEHINASRTVQQLRANVREMEKLCGRVRSEDGDALEKLVRPVKERASAATRDFLSLHSESPAPLGRPQTAPSGPSGPGDPLAFSHSLAASDDLSGAGEGEVWVLAQTQIPLPEIPQDQSAAESWETLEEDLLDLNGLVNEFSELVHSQQAKIDSIEDNVEVAAANVEAGSRSLGKVSEERLPLGG
ncbi:hypothetical protein SKAU_G00214580 [Synaphobranchus kaupii]|uniref:t-SNARE coiled-coil homology domain-containing protein n=1 Tax=Synaphobranchus kaupii TaxID=118154 RepID=A0A9Q1F9J9_SYNKA|nr:hypothetical protein SKAU_G00214580 [Synaphobranchus kaupii]